MRKTALLGGACAWLLASSFASADTYVPPHVTSKGNYVQGHYRTAPNSRRFDNYSTQGNVNPYTGQAGSKPLYPSTPTYKVPKLRY